MLHLNTIFLRSYKKNVFLPRRPKVLLFLPTPDRKSCIFDLVRQKNRIRTTGANKGCLRSYVCHPRLRFR